MEKHEAVQLLKKKGFDAVFESGIVKVFARSGKPSIKEVKEALAAIGYEESFGVVGVSDNKSPKSAYTNTDVSKKDTITEIEENESNEKNMIQDHAETSEESTDYYLDDEPSYELGEDGQLSFFDL